MTCDRYQQMVSAFIDDELSPEDVRPLFAHLGTCDACWTYYRRLECLHAEMQNTPDAAAHAISDQPAQKHRTSYATVALGGYLAFVIGVLLTLLLLPGRPDSAPSPSQQWMPPYAYPNSFHALPWRPQ
jgi:predicted anti-sigma-YlaC factor YlaD